MCRCEVGAPGSAYSSHQVGGCSSWLPQPAARVLAMAHDDCAIAVAAAQLLPFGSRAALEEQGILECTGEPRGSGGWRSVSITPYGLSVLAGERPHQPALAPVIVPYVTRG